MARHHVYLSRATEERIAKLGTKVSYSHMANAGIKLLLDRAEAGLNDSLASAQEPGEAAQAAPVLLAPVQAPAEAAEAPAAPVEPEAPAPIRVRHDGGVWFDFGDACQRLGVDPVDAFAEVGSRAPNSEMRFECTLDELLAICSLSCDYRNADDVRDWSQSLKVEVPA